MESYSLGSKTILIPGVTFEKSSVALSEMAEGDMTERRDDVSICGYRRDNGSNSGGRTQQLTRPEATADGSASNSRTQQFQGPRQQPT
eukprot:scaffold15073_cov110-Skeletonema_dohrnii-CCMP3373.AAC.3